jgi:hypothetical protein
MSLLKYFDRTPNKPSSVVGGTTTIVYNDPTETINIEDNHYNIVEMSDD